MSERLYNVIICDLGSNEIVDRLGRDLSERAAEEVAIKDGRNLDKTQYYIAFEVDEVGFYDIADCIEDLAP